jgi:hypothetical protein
VLESYLWYHVCDVFIVSAAHVNSPLMCLLVCLLQGSGNTHGLPGKCEQQGHSYQGDCNNWPSKRLVLCYPYSCVGAAVNTAALEFTDLLP